MKQERRRIREKQKERKRMRQEQIENEIGKRIRRERKKVGEGGKKGWNKIQREKDNERVKDN